MALQSTVPAGLAAARTAPDPKADTVFHVYGLSIAYEVIGIGGWSEGLAYEEVTGLDAVRQVIAATRLGWDVAGEWLTRDGLTEDFDSPLAHGIEIPVRLKVHAFRVLDVASGAAELWVRTPAGPQPLSIAAEQY